MTYALPSNPTGRRLRAFTLVELLVVLGIIASLIAMLLPTLARARAGANRTVCLSNIRQLGNAILMYCADYRGYFPTCAYWASPPAYVYYPDDWIHWQANRDPDDSAVAPYVGKGEQLRAILRCPADSFEGRKQHLAGIAPGQGPYLYSYGMNSSLASNTGPPLLHRTRTRITQWRSLTRKIMLAESKDQPTAPVFGIGSLLTSRHGGKGRSRGNLIQSPGAIMPMNASAVFLDGHAEGVDQDVASQRIHDWLTP